MKQCIQKLPRSVQSAVVRSAISPRRLAMIIGVILIAVLCAVPTGNVKLAKPEELASKIKEKYCDLKEVKGNVIDQLKEAVHNRQEKLPGINMRYMMRLADYACDLPKRQPLLVWGPPGSGKRGGLQQFVNLWREQGRIVVVIDLSNFSGNLKQLNELIDKAVLEGFTNKTLSPDMMVALDKSIVAEQEELEQNSFVTNLMSYVKMFTKPVLHLIISPLQAAVPSPLSGSVEDQIVDIYEKRLDGLSQYMESVFKTKEDALEEINFKDFFRAIRLISRMEADFAPVIVFTRMTSLDVLGAKEGKTFIAKLTEKLKEFEENPNNVPIIISSTNTLWLEGTTLDQNLFEMYEVQQPSVEQLKVVLVDQLKVWSESELETIYNSVGGHTNSIKHIYRINVYEGAPLSEAIKQVQERFCDKITQAVVGKNSTDIQNVLESLPRAIGLTELLKDEVMSHLLDQEIVYIDSSDILHLVNKGMRKQIEQCLIRPNK